MNIYVSENSRNCRGQNLPVQCFILFPSKIIPHTQGCGNCGFLTIIFVDAVGRHLLGIVGHLLTNGHEFMICDAIDALMD